MGQKTHTIDMLGVGSNKRSALFSDQGCLRGGEGAGEEGKGDSIESQSKEGQCDHAEKRIEDEKR